MAVVVGASGVQTGRMHRWKSNVRYISSEEFSLMRTTTSNGLLHSGSTVTVLDAGRKGRGLLATQSIGKGVLIGLYEGEILTQREYEDRYPLGQSKYVFLLRNDCQRRDRIHIDAADETCSNLTRFMNHSPQPNVQPFMTVLNIPKEDINRRVSGEGNYGVSPPFVGVAFDSGGRGLRLYSIVFRTLTSVSAGEELQFDYGDQYPPEGFL